MIMYLLLIGSSDVQQWNEVCKQAYLHGYSLTMYTSTENGYSLTTYTSTEHALPHPLLIKQDLYLVPTFSFKVVHFVAHLSLTCIISEES